MKLIFTVALFVLTFSFFARAAFPASDWLDTRLSAEERVARLISAMTEDEKQQLVLSYYSDEAPWKKWKPRPEAMPNSAGFVPGLPRLQIPPLFETDAGIGVATTRGGPARARTALPSGLAAAATWNTELAFTGGQMIGRECRASGFNVMLAGGLNLERDPRNGRNFEYAGEDPWLAGRIVGAEVRGIQSNHIISTLKHFALNDQETGRASVDARLTDASARMSDLLAFEVALDDSQPGAVMCAYNKVNGVYACENEYLLNQVLKRDWAFSGFVMSDWGGVHSTVLAANSGLDQESGFPFDSEEFFVEPLKKAISDGQVASARRDDMVSRVLRQMFLKGVFDQPTAGDQSKKLNFAADADVSQRVSEEGIVLLKNDGLLPLQKNDKRFSKIAVIGGHADVGVLSGGGSSQVFPSEELAIPSEAPKDFPGPMVYYPSSPLKALSARLKDRKWTYASGKDVSEAVANARAADVVIVFATEWRAETLDADLGLPGGQNALIAQVAQANPRVIVVLQNGGPIAMPWLKDVKAVIEAWYPGTRGGEAIARILTGEVNPSGHLPVTFVNSVDDLPRSSMTPRNEGDRPFVDYNLEGAAVGYKWLLRQGKTPLFPFGFGLSYTDFKFTLRDVKATAKQFVAKVEVKNVGRKSGQAVVQIYAEPPPEAATHWESKRRLVGWSKVNVPAGGHKTVEVSLPRRALAVFAEHAWQIEPGNYRFVVAESATADGSAQTLSVPSTTLPLHPIQ